MGFNFGELQQIALRVLHNADEAIRKWISMTLAPPQDVTVEYYDRNGNLITETLPNYRKQLQTLLNDKKNLPYLDAGYVTTEQELRDALQNIPHAGWGVVRVNTPIVITSNITLGSGRGCFLVLEDGGQLIFKAYVDTTTATKKLPRINVMDSSYLVVTVRQSILSEPVLGVDLSAVASATEPWNAWIGDRSIFLVVHSDLRIDSGLSTDTTSNKILIDLSADSALYLVHVARASFFFSAGYNSGASRGAVKLADVTTPHKFIHVDSHARLTLTPLISDAAGTITDPSGVYTPYTSGIIYYDVATNTLVPRNVLSGQILR